MNTLKLYSGPLSMFGAKVEIAARQKGLELDLVMVPFDFEHGYAPKHPEVLRITPNVKCPSSLLTAWSSSIPHRYSSTWRIDGQSRPFGLVLLPRERRPESKSIVLTKCSSPMSFG
jgi:hypothetical protein